MGQIVSMAKEVRGLAAGMEEGAEGSRALELVASAIDLAIPDGAREDWRCLPGQLVARLIGYEDARQRMKVDEIATLLKDARRWDGGARAGREGVKWWCPAGQQTFGPAGGACTAAWAGHAEGVTAVAWSPDGKTVCSGSSDKTLRLWNAETGESVRVLEGHTSGVRAVAWSPDGKTVCSEDWDDKKRVWRAETGECLFKGKQLDAKWTE